MIGGVGGHYKMGWKNLPYWLKGGISGAISYIVLTSILTIIGLYIEIKLVNNINIIINSIGLVLASLIIPVYHKYGSQLNNSLYFIKLLTKNCLAGICEAVFKAESN